MSWYRLAHPIASWSSARCCPQRPLTFSISFFLYRGSSLPQGRPPISTINSFSPSQASFFCTFQSPAVPIIPRTTPSDHLVNHIRSEQTRSSSPQHDNTPKPSPPPRITRELLALESCQQWRTPIQPCHKHRQRPYHPHHTQEHRMARRRHCAQQRPHLAPMVN